MNSLELVKPEWHSTMAGAVTMAQGTGMAVIALSGGYMAVRSGYPALFALGAALVLASAVLLWAYFRTPRGEMRPAAAAAVK